MNRNVKFLQKFYECRVHICSHSSLFDVSYELRSFTKPLQMSVTLLADSGSVAEITIHIDSWEPRIRKKETGEKKRMASMAKADLCIIPQVDTPAARV